MTPDGTSHESPIETPAIDEPSGPRRPVVGTILYLVLAMALAAGFAIVASIALGAFGAPPAGDAGSFLTSFVVFSMALAGSVAAKIPFIRRGSLTWTDAGFAGTRVATDLGFGTLLGVASFSIVPLVGGVFGWVRFETGDLSVFPSYAATVAAVLVPAAAFEEVFSRGLPLHYLRRLRGPGMTPARATVVAVLATSLLFSMLHAWNPGFNAIAFLEVLAAGVALAAGRIRTGALWLPIGWHFGWNASQDVLYGFSVSGVTAGTGALLRAKASGPPVLVGGAFGPESGLLSVFATVLFTLLFIALYPKRVAANGTAH